MRTFKYRPTQASYLVEDSASEVLRVQLDGGAARFRRDIIGVTKMVNCRWILGRGGYDYIRAFYRVFNDGARPFLIDLIVEESALIGCKTWFVPQSFRLAEQRGNAYICTAQLEIEPPLYDPKVDGDILDLTDALGENWREWTDRLDAIVNIRWPEVLAV